MYKCVVMILFNNFIILIKLVAVLLYLHELHIYFQWMVNFVVRKSKVYWSKTQNINVGTTLNLNSSKPMAVYSDRDKVEGQSCAFLWRPSVLNK